MVSRCAEGERWIYSVKMILGISLQHWARPKVEASKVLVTRKVLTMSENAVVLTIVEESAPVDLEALVATMLETSAGMAASEERAAAEVSNIEDGARLFALDFIAYLDGGGTASALSDTLKADEKTSAVTHFASSAATLTYVESVGRALAKGGALPEGFVARPDNGKVPLSAEERSLFALVSKVTRGGNGDAKTIFKASKVAYGKAAVLAAVDAAGSTEEAVQALLDLEAKQAAAIKKAETQQKKDQKDSEKDEEEGESKQKSEPTPATKITALSDALSTIIDSIHAGADREGLEDAVAELSTKIAALSLLVNGEQEEAAE